jgi:hypothetical protein
MRKGLLIAGIIVLVIGLAVAVVGIPHSQSLTIPTNGSVEELTIPSVGSASVTLTWSGATSSTQVNVVTCSSGCASIGSTVAQQTGSSGTITFTASSGTTYAIYASQGPSSGVAGSVSESAFTYLELTGVVVLVVGAVLALLGFRMKARVPAPARVAAPAATAAGDEASAEVAPENDQGSIMQAAEPQAKYNPVAGQRANVTCGFCGAVNEPWLTNCRKCKRPLANTSL